MHLPSLLPATQDVAGNRLGPPPSAPTAATAAATDTADVEGADRSIAALVADLKVDPWGA